MTSGLNSSASAMHEFPTKPTLGSRFPLLRQSCVFRPPKETATCHTPSCAWIDNLISMCFSFFIWKKNENNRHFVGFWPPQDCVVFDTAAPLTGSLSGWWCGCSMWLDSCSQIAFFLTLKKITLKLDIAGPNDGSVPTSTDVLRPSSEDCGPVFISGVKLLPALHFPLLPRQVWFLEANFKSLPCEYLKPSRAHSRTVWI